MPIPICCWPEKIKAGILCRDRIFCTLAEARVFFCKKITATAGKRVFVANIVFSGIISISEKKVRIMSKKANQKAKLLYLQQILLEETAADTAADRKIGRAGNTCRTEKLV